jgi:hypothetical protein
MFGDGDLPLVRVFTVSNSTTITPPVPPANLRLIVR